MLEKEELVLKKHNLIECPKIYAFKYIIILDLSRNFLSSLHPGIGHLKKLNHLNVSYNKLKNLPDEISKLASLITLHLDHNNLVSLPHAMGKLKKLETLSIYKNRYLKELPASLSKIEKLAPNFSIKETQIKEEERQAIFAQRITN